MGLRFRKSIKLAPGIKINFGKKGVGASFGGKHGGISFNSKTGTRVRTSIPGSGISYSTKIGTSKKSTSKSSNKPINNKPIFLRWWYICLIVIFAIGGFGSFGTNIGAAIFGIAVSVIMAFFTLRTIKSSKEENNNTDDKTISDQ